VFAIVRTGGKQYKVAVGDVIQVEKLEGQPGEASALPAVLLVDGDSVTSDAEALTQASVNVEIVAQTKGPKINMIHYKNKSGYKRRQGHRQKHTLLKVTGIESGS
jgi:large subunit ribosomal protein L21